VLVRGAGTAALGLSAAATGRTIDYGIGQANLGLSVVAVGTRQIAAKVADRSGLAYLVHDATGPTVVVHDAGTLPG
jgi:hypothetical protein